MPQSGNDEILLTFVLWEQSLRRNLTGTYSVPYVMGMVCSDCRCLPDYSFVLDLLYFILAKRNIDHYCPLRSPLCLYLFHLSESIAMSISILLSITHSIFLIFSLSLDP